jgi:hypothetical protein
LPRAFRREPMIGRVIVVEVVAIAVATPMSNCGLVRCGRHD